MNKPLHFLPNCLLQLKAEHSHLLLYIYYSLQRQGSFWVVGCHLLLRTAISSLPILSQRAACANEGELWNMFGSSAKWKHFHTQNKICPDNRKQSEEFNLTSAGSVMKKSLCNEWGNQRRRTIFTHRQACKEDWILFNFQFNAKTCC